MTYGEREYGAESSAGGGGRAVVGETRSYPLEPHAQVPCSAHRRHRHRHAAAAPVPPWPTRRCDLSKPDTRTRWVGLPDSSSAAPSSRSLGVGVERVITDIQRLGVPPLSARSSGGQLGDTQSLDEAGETR